MRIIAGDYKGRRLDSPIDNKVRPTSDKVKEAMFSILMNHLDSTIACDMFSGTGNLGLEALSRGCDKCYFIDESNTSLKVILENIRKCKAEDYSEVFQGDAIRNLHRIKEKIDIFLIDPPYGYNLEIKALEEIDNLGLLNENGIIIVEHKKNTHLPDKVGNLTKVKHRKYGSVELSIYI